jgi:hypothetical protein
MKNIFGVAFLIVFAAPTIALAAEETKSPTSFKKEISVTIKPDKVHEECIELKSGTSVAYRFEASKPVPFNIHFHSGAGKDEKVEYPVKIDQTDAAEDVLKVANDQHYCWMWSNKKVTTESVTVNGTIERQ